METIRAQFRIRSVAFSLMFVGFVIAWLGMADVFRSYPNRGVFDGGLPHDQWADRLSRGYFVRDLGVYMTLSGPVVWVAGNVFLRLGRRRGSSSVDVCTS